MRPLDLVADRLDERDLLVSRRGDTLTARCPAHADCAPSLSVGEGSEGRALVHCHTGCETADVLDALGLEVRDLFADDGKPWTNAGLRSTGASAESDGRWRLGAIRYMPSANGQPKALAATGATRDLWPDPATIEGETLFVVEGEPDAVSGASLDLPTVAVPGAGKWRGEWGAQLAEGRQRVVVISDADEPGRKAAQRVAVAIAEHCADVRLLDLEPSREDGADLSDWAADAHTAADLASARELLYRAAEDAPQATGPSVNGPASLHETPLSSTTPEPPAWPQELDRRARQGLAGEFLDLVGPQSEADPAALLVQLLVAFGNAVGRGPGFQVGGDFHATNLYVVIVGATATGRKGMSWGAVRDLMGRVDPEWAGRLASGLSSGEGVIHAVRDEVRTRRKAKKSERDQADDDGYIAELADPGEADKRLFAQQGEFAQVLKVMQRDGNTLSAVLRDLWDRGDARTLTKSQPGKTTGALVSVVAHVTPDELREGLTATEQANGFANRYLYVCARRARVLPFGGDIDRAALDSLAARLRGALELARDRGALGMDAKARAAWPPLYGELSAGEDGLLGAVTGRAEAQVRRLAVLYALLDSAPVVGIDHLRAAVAVWDYCRASAAHVFGAASGDPIADGLREALEGAGPDGLSRSQIRDLLGGRTPAERIDTALRRLEARGIAHCERQPTAGRPIERWSVERVGKPGTVEESHPRPASLHETPLSSTLHADESSGAAERCACPTLAPAGDGTCRRCGLPIRRGAEAAA